MVLQVVFSCFTLLVYILISFLYIKQKRDNSTESSRWVSLLNVFPMGRMMGPYRVSGISLSYHGAGGIGKLGLGVVIL